MIWMLSTADNGSDCLVCGKPGLPKEFICNSVRFAVIPNQTHLVDRDLMAHAIDLFINKAGAFEVV